MKTIIFIGSNQFGTSKEALSVAREMGYCVVLFTDKRQHLQHHKFPNVDQIVYFHDLFDEIQVLEELEALKTSGKQLCACVSFIDPFVSYTARLAKKLGLLQLSADALAIMENKIKVRDQLKHLPTSPFYTVYESHTSIKDFTKKHELSVPLIIKSPVSNGSKDVFLAETTDELKQTLQSLHDQTPDLPILIEEYLKGPQYLVEVLVQNRKIEIVGVIEQETTYEDIFIIVGYQFPAQLKDDEYTSLIISVHDIIQKLGLKDGSCHLEMRNVHGAWKLVEINPRMSGGAMNRIIEEGTGINLIKEILKQNVGEEVSLTKTREVHVYAKYLTFETSGELLYVAGEDLAWEHDGVKYVYVKPLLGKIVTAPYSMGQRYACVIAAGNSPENAKATAISAAQELKFYLEPF
ncbi:ATP-grasp domain-containing protein [Cytobacillus depressus]|uniref:ATP-grasp domain-containing protein n=1 Tax=Cytobacillus depressus TaxID=1602942 RepID=A0A6L3UZG3_9BACI|nr:ATP-grasp domain-containing protein [Cytobacillus depressus]KAB2329987.1 ATP-grasp domain-containing protein [Cytobacillus depressus]